MTRHQSGAGVGVGDTLAPFALPIFGKTHTGGWRPGGVTVVSFCALWCDTWKTQSVRLTQTQHALAGLPVTFLTVSVDGRWAERYATGNPSGEVLLDSGGKLSARLGVRAVPYTFVLDRHGVVRFAHQGVIRSDELTTLLRPLAVGAAPAAPRPVVYLTFDDFPTVTGAPFSPDEELLDILRAASSPATFFCVGEHLTEQAGMACARRAHREGHSLQIHSWSHDASDPRLENCRRIMARIAPGVAPTLYRPPGSSQSRRLGGSGNPTLNLPVVNPYDFARPGEAELLRRIGGATRPNAVIQLHAGVEQTRAVLPALLASLKHRGFGCQVLR